MRLVELLARELDEWPEGAKRASQDKDKEIRFDTSWNDFYVETLADDAGSGFGDGVVVTRQEWAAARAKMEEKTEWSGEGLPPVGTVCEAWHNGSAQGVVEVRYAGDCMVLWNVKHEHEQCSVAKNYWFRPVRTPEQIAAQERERALDDIYRIIRTVERPGNKADMAEALYAAGYRKQEKSE